MPEQYSPLIGSDGPEQYSPLLREQAGPEQYSPLVQPRKPPDITAARTGLLQQLGSGQAADPKSIQALDEEATTLLDEGLKGLRRFGYSTIATTQAFLGSQVARWSPDMGEKLIQEGLRTMAEQPRDIAPAVQNWSDVHDLRSGALKFASSVGEGLPSSAIAIGAGLLGRGAGFGVGLARGLRGTALETAVNRAGFGAGMASMLPMEGGETALDLAQDPTAMANTTAAQRANLTLGRGTVNAALENIVPQMLVVPHLLGKAARIAPGFRAGLRNVGLLAGEGALGEYGTEFAQDLTGQYAQNVAHPGMGYNLQQAHEAGLSGAATGIFMGGAGGAAQAVHSNIGAGVDLAKEGVQKVAGKLPKMPTFDDLVGGVLNTVNDPEGTGRALAGGTMEGLAKAAEAAGVLRQYGAKGIETGEEYLSKVYDGTVDFINKKLKDSDIKDEFLQRAAELKTLTKPEWDIFKRDLSDVSGEQFLENVGAAAMLGGKRAVEGAKNVGGWLSDVAKGAYDEFTKSGEGKTASMSAPDRADRAAVMAKLYAASPGLKDAVEKFNLTLNQQRALGDTLHYAMNNTQFFEGATPDSDRGQFLNEWKQRTGTDLTKILGEMRAGRNAVAFEKIAGNSAQVALKQLNINPEHHDNLVDIVHGAPDYASMSPSKQRLLFLLAGKNEIKAQALFAALQSSSDAGQRAVEKSQLGAGRVKSQIPRLTEHMQGDVATGAATESDKGGTTGKSRGYYDELGNRYGEAASELSPFNKEAFQKSLYTKGYEKVPRIPVTLSPQGEHANLNLVTLANAFGERHQDKKTKEETWKPYGKGRVNFDKRGVHMHISPQSLTSMMQSEQFRDQFHEHMVGLDDRPGASNDEITGQRFMNALASLADKGIHLNPEDVGLPKEGPPVHVKVNVDLVKLHDDLIIRQYKGGKHKLTWADVSGKTRGLMNPDKHLERLQKFNGNFEGAYDTLAHEGEDVKKGGLGNRQSDKIAGVIWTRARNRLRKEAGLDQFAPVRNPTPAELDKAAKEYHDAIPGQRMERMHATAKREQLNDLRMAYRDEAITAQNLEDLADWYANEKGANNLKAQVATKAISDPLIDRTETDTTKLAQQIREMAAAADLGREAFENSVTGSNIERNTQSDILGDWLEFDRSLPQETQRYRRATQAIAERKGEKREVPTTRAQVEPEVGHALAITWKIKGKELSRSAAKYEITAVEKTENGYKFSFKNIETGQEYKNYATDADGVSQSGTKFHFLGKPRTTRATPEDYAKPAPAKPEPTAASSADVKTVTEKLTQVLEDRRAALLARAGDNPTLIQRINAHINGLLQDLVKAADGLARQLQSASVGELINKYRQAIIKSLGPLDEAVTKSKSVVQPQRGIVKTMPMVYRDNHSYGGVTHIMRPEFKGKSTLDLIKSGDRTATTRSRSSMEGLKVGDLVRFTGEGGPVTVQVTKAPYPVSSISAEEWSKLEGWEPRLHTFYKSAYQFQYELANKVDPSVSGEDDIGMSDERYNEIIGSAPLDKVSFTSPGAARKNANYTHARMDRVVQDWVQTYLPNLTIKLHIFDGQKGDHGGFVISKPGNNTIFLSNKQLDPVSALSIMAHEFGHLIEYNHYNTASKEVKAQLLAAYNADIRALRFGVPTADGKSKRPLTSAEVIERFGDAAYAAIKANKDKGTSLFDQTSPLAEQAAALNGAPFVEGTKLEYITRMREWMANQFAKKVTQGLGKADTPEMKSFWRGLVKKMKDFFNTVVRKITPNAVYENWVNSLAASAKQNAPAAEAEEAEAEAAAPAKAAEETTTPPLSEAKKRVLAIVHSMMGDKKVQVIFDHKMAEKGRFKTRGEALDSLYRNRNALVDELKGARKRGAQTSIDELTEKIEALDAEEKLILTHQAAQGIIYFATGMEDKAGLAEHETFHAAFHIFFSPEEKRILGTAFQHGLAGKQLRKIFKDDPVVLARINANSEEAAAYAFEIWASNPDAFQLGAQTKTMFEKLMNFVRKLFKVLTMEQKAELILENLKSGQRHVDEISPVAKILDKDQAWQDRALNMAKTVTGLVKNGYDILLSSAYERLINTENPAIISIAKLGYQATGEEGNVGGMVQRGRTEYKKLINQLTSIFRDLTEGELKEMHKHMIFDTAPTDAKLAPRVEALKQWYKDMYTYQTGAGVQLGDAGVKQGYYPLTWDPEKVLKNKKAFIEMLENNYAKELLTTKKTPNEIYNSITSYIDRGEDLVNVMGENKEPLSESAKKRTLSFITREHRLPFMDEDPVHTAFRYAKQAVRQAEYVRSYGMESTKLEALKREARDKYKASPEDMALLNDYIDGLMGNKEVGMSRELKDLYGAMSVYQNYRLLPFSLFSSLVDPMGIAIRSGRTMDAWDTFAYSMKNLFKEWKKDYTRDEWEKLAEDWGIIEHSGTSMSATNLYDGITLRGATKELNDKLFKYNLLNGWIRNNTIMAVKAAQLSFHRAAEGDMGKHSERYLEELGLEKSDVIYDKAQKRILMHADELEAAGKTKAEAEAIAGRIRNAVDKFVRQSLLNPSAAELPNWASNPYLMPIAHLKQFVFAFNATIIDRITHELKHENYKPIALAAAYVPSMIAADFMKDMIAGFGEEPPYKKDWGLYDYFRNGLDRSGLTGTGQFFSDAKEDVVRGGAGVESAFGPMAQQIKQGTKAFSSGNTQAIENFMIKALPLQAAFKNYLPTSPDVVQK